MFLTYLKRTIKTAAPITATQITFVSLNFIGMLMIAQLGHDDLAASALLYPTQVTINVICVSLLFSLSAIVANKAGAKRYKMLRPLLQQSWLLAILLSLPVMLLFWFIKPILLAFGQQASLIDLIVPYFHAAMWGILPLFLSVTCNQFAYGLQKQRLVMYITIAFTSVNLLLGYALIFGAWYFPHYGIAGWGMAMVVANCLRLTLFIICFSRLFPQYRLFKLYKHRSLIYIRKLLTVGWPVSLQSGGELLCIFTVTMMIGWLGKTQLAASQIILQYLLIITIPVFGIAQASNILIGHANGAKYYHRISNIGLSSITLGLLWLALIAISFIIFSDSLADIYLDFDDPKVAYTLHLVKVVFIIIIIAEIADTIINILSGSLRALYDTAMPMAISLVTLWGLRIPLAYIFGFHARLGHDRHCRSINYCPRHRRQRHAMALAL